MLAGTRLAVAASCLIAFQIERVGPEAYASLAAALLFSYVLLSVAVLAAAQFTPSALDGERAEWLLHAIDIVWAAAITLSTGGPVSPYFGLFVVALLSAASRWGFVETLGTAVAAVAVLLVEVLLVSGRAGASPIVAGGVDANLVIVRAMCLLAGGALLGYLMDDKKHLRAEAAAVAAIVERIRPAEGVRAAVQAVLVEVLRVFNARSVLLVAHDRAREHLYLWEAHLASGRTVVSHTPLQANDRPTYLFSAPAEGWYAVKRRRPSVDGEFNVRVLGPGDERPLSAAVSFPEAFLATHPFRSLLVMSVTFGEEWDERLFVVDGGAGVRSLQLLRTIARQAGPAIYSIDLAGRLRARAGAAERARVARELHDGIIQSLIGLEMQVDVWRREAGADSAAAAKLGHIQDLLRKEVLDLRDLLQQMKPVSVDSKQILDQLADLVERFQRQSGIAAHFVSEIDELSLSPRVCSELVRIVQEALVNVRKHSGARNVLVRITAENGRWTFAVDDDGRGFNFSGRHALADLDRTRKGPVVIKERVRSIGGELIVESSPGQGARVEVQLPRATDG